MIDNFNIIRPLLAFENPGDFYFLQILKRRKDNPGMTGDSQVIDNIYIYSLETFDKIKDRVIELCNNNNARAYLRLNRRNNKKIAFMTLKKTTDLIISEEYKAVKNVYESVCGEYHSEENKSWIVDVDGIHLRFKDRIVELIKELHSGIVRPEKPYKIIAEIPTKNGFHIITNPFNLSLFRQKYFLGKVMKADVEENSMWDPKDIKRFTNQEMDIHKDNPTILYCL
jgi:hypothetical protein